jgi:hypothetical protein
VLKLSVEVENEIEEKGWAGARFLYLYRKFLDLPDCHGVIITQIA